MDKYQFTKSWTKKIGFIIGFSLILTALLFLFLVNPKIKELKEFENLIKKTKIETQQYYTFDAISYEIGKTEEILKNIKKEIIPSSEVEHIFLKKINTIAEKINVKVENISSEGASFSDSSGSSAQGFSGSKFFNINFSSDIERIHRFILETERNPFFVIRKLSISSGRNSPKHNVSMKVQVYFSK